MMYPNNVEYLIEERRQEIERKLARAQLLRELPRRPSATRRVWRQVITWLGSQMVHWGAQLQAYAIPAQECQAEVKPALR